MSRSEWVRLLAWLVPIVALGSCGEGAAAPVKSPPRDLPLSRIDATFLRPSVAAPMPALAPAPAFDPAPAPPPDRHGHLSGVGDLDAFFGALAALRGPGAHDDVRILQFGDSHTASDTSTSVVRRLLQAKYGDGGRGYVQLGIPWKNYVQDGVHGYMTKEFEAQRPRTDEGRTPHDGAFGLLGVAVGTDKPGAWASTRITVPSSRVEIDYLEQPRGGSFDVLVDGTPVGRVSSRAAQPGAAYASYPVADGPHEFGVRAVGDGAIRVFGAALDRDRSGVVVDALGINGAQIYTPLRWNEEQFAAELQHRAPSLVVLAYGTNEALDGHLDLRDYEQSLGEMVTRVRRGAPGASCLFLGPPDLARPRAVGDAGRQEWATWPPLLDVIAAQRRAAQTAGCAFFDQMAAMGGAGSMAAWAAETNARAQGDRVHMTGSGYAELGTAFVTDLVGAFEAWQQASER